MSRDRHQDSSGGSSTFSLKWENHHRNILTSVADLTRTESYSDVTLCCDGELFPLHRFILSSCSEYFDSLFRQVPGHPLVVVLKDIQLCELKALLSYIYLGEVNISQDDLPALIKAAEFLKIKGLATSDAEVAKDGRRDEGGRFESKRGKKRRFDENLIGNERRHSTGSLVEETLKGVDKKRRSDSNSSPSSKNSLNESCEDTSATNCSFQTAENTFSGVWIKPEPDEDCNNQSFDFKQEDDSADTNYYHQNKSNNFLYSDSTNTANPSTTASKSFNSSCNYSSQQYKESSGGGNMSINARVSDESTEAGLQMPSLQQVLEENPIDHMFPDIVSSNDSNKYPPSDSSTNASSWPASQHQSSTQEVNPRGYLSCHYGQTPSLSGGKHSTPSGAAKLHTCPFDNCQVSYKEKRALQDHMNLHTGHRPYFCNMCNFSTSHRTTLIQHKKYKHQ